MASYTMSKADLVLVAGAGGFIGGHLVADLRKQGFRRIRGVGVKPIGEWYQHFDDVENVVANLSELEACRAAAKGAVNMLRLAAGLGGMGFIRKKQARCILSGA